ncbi:MAG: hypothetical protein ACOC5T_00915 [Elusimicrobiota bacterium]
MNDKQTKPRVTKVTKGIERVYNIGNYESVRVIETLEETIEWSSIEERQTKLKNINKHLVADFNITKNDLFVGLGMSEKKAFGKEKANDKVTVSDDVFDGLDT